MINFANKKQQLKNREAIILQHIEKQKKIKETIDKHNQGIRTINLYNKLNVPFQLKEDYNSIIPLNLYTCWHTKDLPPLMQQNYVALKEENPEFNHYLYDENECRQFIQNNFDTNVLGAYNSLIPCSYKSDLWRFCVLYINGGIYYDIKFSCANNFKFIALTEQEHFIRDMQENCVLTGLIVTLPKNPILLNCINQITNNVKTKFYGENPLYPTGPGLLGRYFTNEERKNMDMYLQSSVVENKLNEYYIVSNNTIILKYYNEYRTEQKSFQKNKHYHDLWHDKNIYL